MTFTEYETKLLATKPRFLNDEEKRLRRNCKVKIGYEKNKQTKKIYYQTNREQIIDNQKEYNQTPKGYKATKKNHWKIRGLNMDNFEEIFKRYCETTNCDNCNVLLTIDKHNTKTTKSMDHDHTTREFRNILCHTCNVRRK